MKMDIYEDDIYGDGAKPKIGFCDADTGLTASTHPSYHNTRYSHLQRTRKDMTQNIGHCRKIPTTCPQIGHS